MHFCAGKQEAFLWLGPTGLSLVHFQNWPLGYQGLQGGGQAVLGSLLCALHGRVWAKQAVCVQLLCRYPMRAQTRCPVGCKSMNSSSLCSPGTGLQLSVYATTESGGKHSPVAFGLPRSKASTDTEKEDFFCSK